MTDKIKTITVQYGVHNHQGPVNAPLGYRVERVTDSTEFNPGVILTKAQVDELCAAKSWKVTIQGVR